jgi:hypothetical protein
MQDEMRNEMKRHYVPRGVKFVLFAVLFVALLFLLGFVVMWLWNWLMPALFGLKSIGYWQAFGLIILSKILFGGFARSGGGGGYRRRRLRERWRQRMWERWEEMTPEEREKFRQGLRGCWDREAPPQGKASG